MGHKTGIVALGDYATPATLGGKIDALIALLADNDTADSSGAQAGGGLLDEISPPANTQLLVELDSLKDAINQGVGGDVDGVAYGQHTVTAGEATANQVDIVTGLADTTVANIGVTVSRAGSIVTADAAITEPVAGTIRVADGSTYNTTAGDIITWVAFDPA